MTKQQAIQKLKKLKSTDPEDAHIEADRILCALLTELGFEEVVAEFVSLPKWYA